MKGDLCYKVLFIVICNNDFDTLCDRNDNRGIENACGIGLTVPGQTFILQPSYPENSQPKPGKIMSVIKANPYRIPHHG